MATFDDIELIEIPVTPTPAATFEIDLDGAPYRWRVRWNERDLAWYADILGLDNDVDLKGLKLVPGVDLLGPAAFGELGQLIIFDNEEILSEPTFEGFGDRFRLYYISREYGPII